jgi:hypothetical protein
MGLSGRGLLTDALHADSQQDYQETVMALASHPDIREMLEHVERVVTRAQEDPDIIFSLLIALPNFALVHPDWDHDQEGKPVT